MVWCSLCRKYIFSTYYNQYVCFKEDTSVSLNGLRAKETEKMIFTVAFLAETLVPPKLYGTVFSSSTLLSLPLLNRHISFKVRAFLTFSALPLLSPVSLSLSLSLWLVIITWLVIQSYSRLYFNFFTLLHLLSILPQPRAQYVFKQERRKYPLHFHPHTEIA